MSNEKDLLQSEDVGKIVSNEEANECPLPDPSASPIHERQEVQVTIGEGDTEIIVKKWKFNVLHWVYGLISAFIGGGASAVTAGVSGAMIDPDKFNLGVGMGNMLKLTGTCFTINGLMSAFMYLKQSPLPPEPNGLIAKAGMLCMVLALTGCTTFKYRDIEIKSFLNKKAIKSATLSEKDTNGVTRSIKIEGYSSDQTEAFAAAIEAMKAGAAMAK